MPLSFGSMGGSKPVFKNIHCLLIFQIICRVYTCFEGTCNEIRFPTDSRPYKPAVEVCTLNNSYA